MTQRKLLAIFGISLLAGVLLLVCLPTRVPGSDAEKYERWKETTRLYKKTVEWKTKMPQSLVQLFGLSRRGQGYMDEHDRLGVALLASGYLTNVVIPAVEAVPNSASPGATIDRIRKASQEDWSGTFLSTAMPWSSRVVQRTNCSAEKRFSK